MGSIASKQQVTIKVVYFTQTYALIISIITLSKCKKGNSNEAYSNIEKVITGGAELYCERLGSGPLPLLITGGMDDAGFYSSAADILVNEFTLEL